MKMVDKVALVTGGSNGIGRATALAFAREGARVVVADVAVEAGEESTQLIYDQGGGAIFVKCDVSNSDEVQALMRHTLENYGRLDFAFNNAGIVGTRAHVDEYPEAIWEKVIAVNLTGVYLCMKYELPLMVAQKKGAIVNNASVLGLITERLTAPYVASKHGVLGLTKTAALEYVRKGVRVNAVCPGFVETDMTGKYLHEMGISAQMIQSSLQLQPMKRMGKPEEIAEAVVWLCSDEASFVNGHGMVIDGGLIVQ